MKSPTPKSPSPETPSSPQGRDEDIATLAYQIWEEEGRPEGRADEHWFRASSIINGPQAEAELPGYLSRSQKQKQPPAPESTASSEVITLTAKQRRAAG